MSSHELFSDTMYRQHVIAHIYLLHSFLLEDCDCEKVRKLVPKKEQLDKMSASQLVALFDRLCALGKTLDSEAVRSVRSTLYLF